MGCAVKDSDRLWKNATVPYVIDNEDFPEKINGKDNPKRKNIEAAIRQWNEKTLIRLIPRGKHKDYVIFIKDDDCSSEVGRCGDKQEIKCTASSQRTVAHEIGHAVGLYHEHVRSDRNNRVTVHWNNIWDSKKHNYRRPDGAAGIGEYDEGSIMHYREKASSHARVNSRNVLTHRFGTPIGRAKALAPGDIRTVEILYTKSPGNLLWYNHRGHRAGSNDWVFDYGKQVGTGWQRFTRVFSTGNGVIYAIEKNGDLKWYRHEGFRNGSSEWAHSRGKRVGTGWQRFRNVFATSNGVIYAIEKNGDLKWYLHRGFLDGSASWEAEHGKRIGTGWQRFRHAFASLNGIIYAIEKNGDLKWYRHRGFLRGTKEWQEDQGKLIGTGWQRFRNVVAASNGVLYGIERNGDLMWYLHRGFRTGAFDWEEKKGRKIGTGWSGFTFSTGNGIIYRRT